MSLTGWPFLALLIAITAAMCGGIYGAWNHWPYPAQIPGRILSLLLVMVLGAALGGDLLNRSFDFYSSFGDLLGRPPGASAFAVHDAPKAAARVDILATSWEHRASADARRGHGTLLTARFPGARSGLSRVGEIYLPRLISVATKNGILPRSSFSRGFPVIRRTSNAIWGSAASWTVRSVRAASRRSSW